MEARVEEQPRTLPRMPGGHPADAPEWLPGGERLGRVIRLGETTRKYGQDLVAPYAAAYSEGDELSYAVLCEIREGDEFGWPEFHAALEDGPRPDAPASVHALFEEAERIPGWVDWGQLRRGAIAFWRSGPIVVLALTSDLGRGFKNYGGMKPTIFTGRLIDEARVGRRLVETLRYIAKVTTPGAMRRDRDGWKYTMRLRMLHAGVRYGCSRAPSWDWADWGLPVNSADNLGAPLEFSVGLIDMLEQAGIRLEGREQEDIVALWRYIAFVLGTPEHLLMTDAADARRRLAVMDALNHPPDETNRLMLHSLVSYAAREGIGYDPFPAWLGKRLSTGRRRDLTYGFMYAWAGDEVARQMEIPRTPYRHLVRMIRPFLRARDLLEPGTPSRDERACERMLERFGVVTGLERGEQPLADPDGIVADINSRRRTLASIFAGGGR